MPDRVFSAARLRGYRVLEQEGLGAAADLQILNTIASARLWLPLSLIEIAFRNTVDSLVSAAHPAGQAWLCEASDGEDDVLDWRQISGRTIFRRAADATETEDDSPVDPVAAAARMAASHDRTVTRDDVVAHLMLGFWVFRGPDSLLNESPPIDVYRLLTEFYSGVLGSIGKFRSLMSGDILLTRNRVAHHEPMLIRARYIFDKRTGEPRTGNDLVTSLIGALGKFQRLADTVIRTARVMAPMATHELDQVRAQIDADIKPLDDALQARFQELRRMNDERRAGRRAAWAREHPDGLTG